jgi:phage tail sheath gpL-like
MPATIQLTGIGATDPTPNHYIEINFAVGGSAGFQGERPALLIGNKTSAGDATVDTVIYGPQTALPIQTEAEVISRFGVGSELHRMWKRFTAVNRETAVYAIAVTASGGVAATTNIVFTNAATADGTCRIWVQDEFVDVPITSGDAVATIAANARTIINAKTHWALTAGAPTGGSLPVTAKIAGPRGNEIRVQAAIYTSGTIATTVSPTANTALSSGATEDSYTTALTTILSKQFYYIVSASNLHTGQLDALLDQVRIQATPTEGNRQRVFAGFTGSSANAITAATHANVNYERCELIWSGNSDWTSAELAANNAALYSLFELGAKPRNNFSNFGQSAKTRSYWFVPAPRDGSAPTKATIKSLLNNGVTPVGVGATGQTYLAKRVTTRSLTGATADYRIRDAHRVTQCDFFADDLYAKLTLQFDGKDLGNDLAVGQKPTDPDLVTPSIIKAAVLRLIDDYAENSRVKNVATIKADTVVQRSVVNTNRVEIRIPLTIVDILDQTTTSLDQSG